MKYQFNHRTKVLLAISLLIMCNMAGRAQDTQWRGPERDGKYPDTGLLKHWPEGGPELLLMKDGLGMVIQPRFYMKGSNT